MLFMRSDGGLAPMDAFSGSRAVLSGPAGGVVGYSATTYQAEGGQPVIGFDMGGMRAEGYEPSRGGSAAGGQCRYPGLRMTLTARSPTRHIHRREPLRGGVRARL